MTSQRDLFLPMCGRSLAKQGQLFDTDGPTAVNDTCRECGEFMERTPSGFLACTRGHGKLLSETSGESADGWPEQVRRLAKRHARRDNWLGTRWRCQCGACNRARLDGFIPCQRIER
jgi:hypothetical protein